MTVRVPPMGESTAELVVIELLRDVGESVSVGQSLVVLEAEKTNVEVPSPVAGIVTEMRIEVDQTVEVGDQICVVEASR